MLQLIARRNIVRVNSIFCLLLLRFGVINLLLYLYGVCLNFSDNKQLFLVAEMQNEDFCFCLVI